MTRPTSRFGTVALTTVTALALVLPASAIAITDGDKLDERSETTWRVLPDEGVVHVSTTATLTNQRKPGAWRRVPCKGGKRGVCKERTRYYFDRWETIWISNAATGLVFDGKDLTSEFTDVVGTGSRYTVSFPRIDYKQKQQVTIDYDLPSVEAGIEEPTRIEEAYIHLCWYGEDTDGGTVKAFLPPGFEPIANYYDAPKVEQGPGGVVLSKPTTKGNPAEFFACTEAIAPDRYEYTHLTGDDDQGLITVAAWPGDDPWASRTIAEAEMARPWLETQLGSTLPVSSLTLREVSTQGRRRGGADLWPIDGAIGISEAVTEAGAISVPLARLWFSPSAVAEPWLAEGLAVWAGHAAIGSGCPEPVVPEDGVTDLGEWVTAGPLDDLPTWDRSRYQSAVTCQIVQTAADAIGSEAMTAVLAELLASPTPVGVTDWLVEVAVASEGETVDAIRAVIGEAGLSD